MRTTIQSFTVALALAAHTVDAAERWPFDTTLTTRAESGLQSLCHSSPHSLKHLACGSVELSEIRGGARTPTLTAPFHNSRRQPLQKVPLVLRPWIYLYNTVPTMSMPFTDLSIGFTIFSALLFTCIDYSVAFMLGQLGWPHGKAPEAMQTRSVAGSITSIFHSMVLVMGLGACLWSFQCTPSAKLSDAPGWWRDASQALIECCTGYMLYDATIQFIVDNWVRGSGPVLSNSDWMFLGHHAATSLYMTSARVLQAGHVSAMILMAGGEFTAPFQNVLRISRILETMGCGGSLCHILHPYIRYVWAALYSIFRILVGPLSALHLTQDLLFTKKGRECVPLGLSCVWLVMCWAVLLGSIPWIHDALLILRQGLRGSG